MTYAAKLENISALYSKLFAIIYPFNITLLTCLILQDRILRRVVFPAPDDPNIAVT
jgi:hypothetical protein